VVVTNSTFSGNIVGRDGGGFSTNNGDVTVTDSIFSDNSVGSDGGGIDALNGTVRVSDSIFSNNTSPVNDGGGIQVYYSTLLITNTTFNGNHADQGGGIYSYDSDVTVTNSTFSGNSAGSHGGGIYMYNDGSTSTLNLINCTITGNSAGSDGGGIYLENNDNLNITNSMIVGNSAGSNNDEIDSNSAAVTFIGNNLVGTSAITSAQAFDFTPSGASVISATSDSPTPYALTDIITSVLAINGASSGRSLTHALVAESPAIHAGDNAQVPSALITDQRGPGFARIYDETVDIGAFEAKPEIEVTGNSTLISNGASSPNVDDHTDFGSLEWGKPFTRTFTINSTGGVSLTVGALTVSGPNASDFTVTQLPNSALSGDGSTTFKITFNPSAVGLRSATVQIVSNDIDDDPYEFNIQGTGFSKVVTPTPRPTATYTPTPTPTPSNFVALGPVTTVAHEGAGTISVNLLLVKAASIPINVKLSSRIEQPDYAIAGLDYGMINYVITFQPGETFKSFTVPLNQDTKQEANEQFRVIIEHLHPLSPIPPRRRLHLLAHLLLQIRRCLRIRRCQLEQRLQCPQQHQQ